jgi:hypothetical protein
MCNCGANEILLELSFNQLKRQTTTGPTIGNTPRVASSKKVQIQEVTLVPAIQNKTLTAKSRTRSTNGFYETIIEFSGVDYFREGGNGRQEFQGSDGATYWIDPIRPYKSNVKVRCGCLDFYFRFSVWDQRDKALNGPPPAPYHRKTDTYPPVNPSELSGVCKHIIALVEYLTKQKLIR